jgi:transposase
VLDEQIGRIEAAARAQGELRPEYRVLRSVKGIGQALGLTIMYETGDIHRFAKVGNYASYCRTVSTKRLSNGKRKGSGNRRNGNRYLSWAFSEAAYCVVRFEPLAKRYYDRKIAHTNWFVTMAAIANKLARACFYVLRDQVPFEPERAFG